MSHFRIDLNNMLDYAFNFNYKPNIEMQCDGAVEIMTIKTHCISIKSTDLGLKISIFDRNNGCYMLKGICSHFNTISERFHWYGINNILYLESCNSSRLLEIKLFKITNKNYFDANIYCTNIKISNKVLNKYIPFRMNILQKINTSIISLPDYDTIKEGIQKIYDALKANQAKELQAKAGLLAMSIKYQIELADLLILWNTICNSEYSWTEEEIEKEVVHVEMLRQYTKYLKSLY